MANRRLKTEKGCPFCGFNSTQVIKNPKQKLKIRMDDAVYHPPGHQVECINCGARGPCGFKSKKEAVLAWDRGDNYFNPNVNFFALTRVRLNS